MRPRRPGAPQRRRAGITMTEMVIATGLATLLVMLLATTWATFGSTALEIEARARIQREGLLAVQTLAYDLGGFLNDDPSCPMGRSGGMMSDVAQHNPCQFLDWSTSTPGVLLLNYSGGSSSPAYTVMYQLEGNQLVRTCTNLSTAQSTKYTVARYVAANGFGIGSVNSNQVEITLRLAYRNITSTFTLRGVPPS